MSKRSYLITAAFTVVYLGTAGAQQQYPIMEKVADKIIHKYQSSSCEQLYQQKTEKKQPPSAAEKAVQMLHQDPQMRTALINKIAAPIANKMFECGMIP